MLIACGIPWPCGMPSPNGEVTRVVMMNPPKIDMPSKILARLELPGEGTVAVCQVNGGEYMQKKEGVRQLCPGNFLLHSTPTSLTSYPIIFPPPTPSHSNVPTRVSTPAPRSVSSTQASPNPDSVIRRAESFASLRDVEPSREKERGFAKFLAGRRNKGVEEKEKEDKVGLGEGKEVERDGGGLWSKIKLEPNGAGLGMARDAVDVS
jgi:hypothetical protein